MHWAPILADRLFARSARWPMIGLFAVAFLIASILIFAGVDRFTALSGGLPLLEVPSLTSPAALRDLARSYSPDAVHVYQTVIQPLDMLFPLTAGVLFGTLYYLLWTRCFGRTSPWRALALLGPALTLLDYLENGGVFVLLRTMDDPPAGVTVLIRSASLAKFLVGVPLVAGISALAVLFLIRRIIARRARTVDE